jgi:hypothetical protein
MKKIMVLFAILMVTGILFMIAFNAIGFRPLDIVGNDPNSNAMIFGILYIIIGAILWGIRSDTYGMNLTQQVDYFMHGYPEEMKQQNARFPLALTFIVSGVLFIILYLVLNRITLK